MKDKELLDYWLILYRRRWLIIFVMIASIATTMAYSFFLPVVYQSKAVFFIPRSPDVVSFLSSDDKLLRRSPLLPEIAEEPHSPYMGLLKSKSVRTLVQKDFPHKTIGDLKSDVDFSLSNEYMIEVYARDLDPVKAAGIANAYVKYLNQLVDSYSKSLTGRHELNIEQEIEGVQAKLDNARQHLKEFQEKSNAVALGEEKAQLVSQKMKLEAEVDADKIALHENNTKISALQQQITEEEKLISSSDSVVRTSPLLEKLRMDLVNVEVNMTVKRTEIRESHPDFIVLKNQYERLKENISSEIERIVKSQIKGPDTFYENIRRQLVNLLVDQQRIKARQEAYIIVIGSIEKKIKGMPELLVQEDVLATEVAKYKKMVQTLEMDLQEAKMQKAREPQNVVLVEEAVPGEPSFPVLWLNMLVAAVVGMIGGVFYVFFIDYLEGTKEQRIFKLVRAIEASEQEE